MTTDTTYWCGGPVQCDICTYQWVAVYPAQLDKLECPNCSNMVSFEEK